MKRLLLATVGDTNNGLGHVSRSLVLARELARRRVDVWFVTEPDTVGAAWLEKSEFPVTYFDEQEAAADAYLIDVEHGPERKWLEYARANYPRLIVVAGNGYTLQDYPAVRELADLEIYQGLDEMPGDKAISGPAHILIDSAYRDCRPNVGGPVVVNWGGADPHLLTEPTLAALAGLERQIIAVVGPARPPLVGDYPGVTVVHAPLSLRPYLNGAALFVGAFGTVVWEACAAGVPSIMLGWSVNHVETQAKLQALGVGRNLGKWDDFDAGALRLCVETMLAERKLWPRYSGRARELVDGLGAARVADRIQELLR